ncbi:hypothetical protein J6590_074846 [Homalodisca vitripennis]|nr:hypothetical protein J6590_074846 [Homalodisca vitripennis]
MKKQKPWLCWISILPSPLTQAESSDSESKNLETVTTKGVPAIKFHGLGAQSSKRRKVTRFSGDARFRDDLTYVIAMGMLDPKTHYSSVTIFRGISKAIRRWRPSRVPVV